MSQIRSVLIAQQESLIQTLFATMLAMFGIVHDDDKDADNSDDEFDTFEQ
uniref:Uncharacterized protein n=1 Tax=Peronospora matthiolae TaxID=2874970 RepID=A0AAV1V4G1_9STRA